MSEAEIPVKRPRGRPKKVQVNPAVEREPKRPMFRMQSDFDAFDPFDENTPDRLKISPDEIPEGFTFQWVRLSTLGQPDDANVQSKMKNGWMPVCRGDCDGKFDHRFLATGKGEQLTVDGTLGLMYRSMEIHKRAKAQQLQDARSQLEIKERALRGGDLPNVSLDAQHPTAIRTNRISKSMERIEIPDK